MRRAQRRALAIGVLAGLAMLSGCSTPGNDPTMSSTEAAAAVGEVAAAVGRFSGAAEGELEQAALQRLLAAPLQITVEVDRLPRGVFALDDSTGDWLLLEPANVLELHWAFDQRGKHDAVLRVDWTADAPSTIVKLEDGSNHEAPQGAAAELHIDGQAVGELAFGGRYALNECGYSEPVRVDLDGDLGDDDQRLELRDFTMALEKGADTTFTSSGEVAVSADDDRLSLDWQVSLSGDIADDESCHVVDASVSSGEATVGVAADVFGQQHSLRFGAGFSDIEVNEVGISSIAFVDGRIHLDGVLAVEFDGVLDDANGNGIPGENLILSFAHGETMTLEEFLQRHVPGLARALNIGALLR